MNRNELERLNNSVAEVRRLTGENEKLRKELATRAGDQFEKNVQLESEVAQLKNELSQVSERYADQAERKLAACVERDEARALLSSTREECENAKLEAASLKAELATERARALQGA